MHVLFLTQIIPYPPDAGPKVKTWQVLRYLASRGHRVTLASFVRPEEEPYVNDLREVCQDVYTVPIQRSRIRDAGYWIRSNFTGRPFLIERDDLVGMRRLIERILAEERIDLIHADQLTMTQFALPRHQEKRTPTKQAQDGNNKSNNLQPELLFDAHNAVWTIVERMRENAPWYLRPIGYLEEQRIKRYEGMVVSLYDHTLAVTEPDHLALKEAVEFFAGDHEKNKDSITVIPIAVDTEKLQPVSRKSDSKNIVTLGTLHYPPNADGIRWFAEEVFPLVHERDPDTTLTIIGKNPPPDFYQLQEKHPDSIEVTGYVQDLVPYLERAALMVIAVRAGGGMRVRILEAFARGMPVVTTTVGLEGIEAQPGKEILVEDSPREFAQAVLNLMNDPELGLLLAKNGRQLAVEQYDWQVVLQKMDTIYQRDSIQEYLGESVYAQTA
jgi:glycosyltransferase involved in cell wall biosynthesis